MTGLGSFPWWWPVCLTQLHPGDAVPPDLGDLQFVPDIPRIILGINGVVRGNFHDIPHPAQASELHDNPPRHRLIGALGEQDAGDIGEILQVGAGVHQLGFMQLHHGMVLIPVVFIPDLPDQFLQQIFKGDQAVGAAVFIHHHGNVVAAGPHLAHRRR